MDHGQLCGVIFPLETGIAAINDVVAVTRVKTQSVETQVQKYNNAFQLCKKLASLTSEGSMELFTERVAFLKKLIDSRKKSQAVVVTPIILDKANLFVSRCCENLFGFVISVLCSVAYSRSSALFLVSNTRQRKSLFSSWQAELELLSNGLVICKLLWAY